MQVKGITEENDVACVLQTVLETMKILRYRDNVFHPTSMELRKIAERYGSRTVYGNWISIPKIQPIILGQR